MDQQEKPTKFLYLPQAKNDHFIIGGADDRPDASVPGSEPEPGPEEPTGIYPCPCCGYLTFPAPKEEAIAYICPVCFWENDVFDPGEDDPSDENRGLTLRQGRENYRRWGAVRPDLVVHARPGRRSGRKKCRPPGLRLLLELGQLPGEGKPQVQAQREGVAGLEGG